MSKSNPVHLWRFGCTRALIFTQKWLYRPGWHLQKNKNGQKLFFRGLSSKKIVSGKGKMLKVGGLIECKKVNWVGKKNVAKPQTALVKHEGEQHLNVCDLHCIERSSLLWSKIIWILIGRWNWFTSHICLACITSSPSTFTSHPFFLFSALQHLNLTARFHQC